MKQITVFLSLFILTNQFLLAQRSNSNVFSDSINTNKIKIELGFSPYYIPNPRYVYKKKGIYVGIKFNEKLKPKSSTWLRSGFLYLQDGHKDSLKTYLGWKNLSFNFGCEQVFPIKNSFLELFYAIDASILYGFETEGLPYGNYVAYFAKDKQYGLGVYGVAGANIKLSKYLNFSIEGSIGGIGYYYKNIWITYNIYHQNEGAEFAIYSNRPLILSLSLKF